MEFPRLDILAKVTWDPISDGFRNSSRAVFGFFSPKQQLVVRRSSKLRARAPLAVRQMTIRNRDKSAKAFLRFFREARETWDVGSTLGRPKQL